MAISAGDVIRIRANFTNPPKPKYLICVCPKNCYYLVINSEPYQLAAEAQLRVTKGEIGALEHTSYIDTAKLVKLTRMETQGAVDADPRCQRGSLLPVLRTRVRALIEKHGIMPKDQIEVMDANWPEAKPPKSGGAIRTPKRFSSS